jgi:hypothetical protein
MGSSADDLLIDDEEDDFLDPNDPEDAIRVAKQALSKKIREFHIKRESLLAMAASVHEGCTENLSRTEVDRYAGMMEEEISYWQGRKNKALARLDQEYAGKQARLDTLGSLTRVLSSERALFIQLLRDEMKHRDELIRKAQFGYLRIGRYTKILLVLHFTLIALLMATFLFPFLL